MKEIKQNLLSYRSLSTDKLGDIHNYNVKEIEAARKVHVQMHHKTSDV